MTQLSHRPDIDGLRALAILPVVLYHAGLPGFGGGFVGVDVFFVISGFLITRLICAELDAGSFTLAGFYERRLRRLAPALLAVLLFTAVAAHFLLLPSFHVEFSRALLATLLFGANIHQALLLSDYFAPNADTQPLLHMWSLAVEEQFYLLFPLLLMWLSKNYAKQQRLIVAAIALGSLALCIVWTPLHPAGAFYFPHTRAWELLLGALLALGVAPTLSRATAEALALLGLLCIGISVTAFSDATAFPGWAALLPCMGTALCIHANSDRPTSVGLWLSWRPVVYIGLISYSLYLWHWPLLVLSKYWLLREIPWQTERVLALSLVAAVLSYHFIEQPCRQRSGGIPLRLLLSICIAITMALALVAIYGITQSRPEQPPLLELDAHRTLVVDRHAIDCATEPAFTSGARLCQLGSHTPDQSPPQFLLWGDSHSGVQRLASHYAAQEFDLTGQWVKDRKLRCPVFCPNCTEYLEQVLGYISQHSIKHVLLVCRWDYLLNPHSDHPTANLYTQAEIAERMRSMFEDIRAAGADTWFMMQVPFLNISWRKLLYTANRFQATKPTLYIQEQGDFRARLRAVLKDAMPADGVHILNPIPLMCSQQGCPYLYQGDPLYDDKNHVNAVQAVRYKEVFRPMMEAIVASQKPVDSQPNRE